MVARGASSKPNPFSVPVPNCLATHSSAYAFVNTQSSRVVRGTSSPNNARTSPSCRRSSSHSLGSKLRRMRSIHRASPSAAWNSPVLKSSSASPTPLGVQCREATKWLTLLSSTWSCVTSPGVTNSVTPLLTKPLACLGSSNWSHTAT